MCLVEISIHVTIPPVSPATPTLTCSAAYLALAGFQLIDSGDPRLKHAEHFASLDELVASILPE